MSDYKSIFEDNIKRVKALKSIYASIGSESTSKYKGTDILRAATVFLHSSFEKYYRCVVTEWLPKKGEPGTLKTIALPEDAGRNKVNYSLYDLLQKHGANTIQNLFQEAVAEHMSRSSFNSYGEICSWGSKIGLVFSSFKKGTEIEKAIHRRHKIVHEADLKIDSSGKKTLSPIKESDIDNWLAAYTELVDIIDVQINTW